jgi:hypothetical protein
MNRCWYLALALAALGLLCLAGGETQAGRIPSRKTVRPRTRLFRPNIRVPYLTNTGSALGVAQGVAPRIYSYPQVDNTRNPGVRRTYNLPYYGAKQAFSGHANGVVDQSPRTSLLIGGR